MFMRKNFGAKPYLYPQPVLMIATYDENGNPNCMNAAWGGICDYDKIMLDLGSHKTTDNIAQSKAFTVSVGDAEHVSSCDYVGIVSGNDVPDKFARAGFTAVKSEFVNAPIICELPLTIECELAEIVNGEWYVGRIVNVSADESILGTDGKPDLGLFHPITFDTVHNQYLALGDVVGRAFSDGMKLK